ncbi:hypothetical protein HGRIS_012341 [Hohenbuehelia grisea]|uniref:Uncharacterized protein n=1 Tax=Hohenbuehelia grisea TaxID=104357 RepID=A0ABR3IS02_9AGAR
MISYTSLVLFFGGLFVVLSAIVQHVPNFQLISASPIHLTLLAASPCQTRKLMLQSANAQLYLLLLMTMLLLLARDSPPSTPSPNKRTRRPSARALASMDSPDKTKTPKQTSAKTAPPPVLSKEADIELDDSTDEHDSSELDKKPALKDLSIASARQTGSSKAKKGRALGSPIVIDSDEDAKDDISDPIDTTISKSAKRASVSSIKASTNTPDPHKPKLCRPSEVLAKLDSKLSSDKGRKEDKTAISVYSEEQGDLDDDESNTDSEPAHSQDQASVAKASDEEDEGDLFEPRDLLQSSSIGKGLQFNTTGETKAPRASSKDRLGLAETDNSSDKEATPVPSAAPRKDKKPGNGISAKQKVQDAETNAQDMMSDGGDEDESKVDHDVFEPRGKRLGVPIDIVQRKSTAQKDQQKVKAEEARQKKEQALLMAKRTANTARRYEWMDGLLIDDYVKLEPLSYVAALKYSTGSTEFDENKLLRASDMLKDIPKRETQAILHGIRFVKHGRYVNPSRVSASDLVMHGGWLRVADPSITDPSQLPTAIFVSIGACGDCNLHQSTDAYGGCQVKNISLFPLSQEFHSMVALMGKIVGSNKLQGPFAGSKVTFSTRKSSFIAKPGSGGTTGPSIPKGRKMFSGRSPVKNNLDDSFKKPVHHLPDVHLFTDDDDYQEHTGTTTTNYTIAAVGYTVNVWKKDKEPPTLNFYVQWALAFAHNKQVMQDGEEDVDAPCRSERADDPWPLQEDLLPAELGTPVEEGVEWDSDVMNPSRPSKGKGKADEVTWPPSE